MPKAGRQRTAPYGTWPSPIGADLIIQRNIGLMALQVAGDDLYWLESRPAEAGRVVLVRRFADGAIADITPPPFNVRSRVHEYGGGAYRAGERQIVFSNFTDNAVHLIADDRPAACIAEGGDLRYADFRFVPNANAIVAVREDHRAAGEPANTIVVLSSAGPPDEGRVLAAGADFYACARPSPDGQRIAWIEWDHPNMPWDGTRLMLARFGNDGALGDVRQLAGGPTESIFQPEWSPAGVLHFASDRTGWWNLYRLEDGGAVPVCRLDAEIGLPLWQFGMASYGFEPDGGLVCEVHEAGRAKLARILDGALRPFELAGFSHADLPQRLGDRQASIAGSATAPAALVLIDADGGIETVRRAADIVVDAAQIACAEAIAFPSAGGATAHAFFYAPRNADFAGPTQERPPLIVRSHGGPTGAASDEFALAIQFWTSRGFAVVDVNYRGSTGFGRDYRRALDERWGIADVEDCVAAVRFLGEAGRIDPDRVAIRGGSAGGYTTLCALTFTDVFRAGASLYGIGDLMALARDTHKFESRYLDRLIGPLPEHEQRYHDRSPIHFTERLNCPVIFLQGLDDKVVPPNQAEAMVAALQAKGLPVAYLAFAGEGHGFRQAASIKRALEAELYFYGRVFGFAPADEIEPVAIDNLD